MQALQPLIRLVRSPIDSGTAVAHHRRRRPFDRWLPFMASGSTTAGFSTRSCLIAARQEASPV
ncbi:hypothetical protein FDZ84_32510 [Saccharopolyspora sp. ASAGF58]|nr:hypothetical protein FDZ84_32510 [Saccharopolyspora sp. ASAGF58]